MAEQSYVDGAGNFYYDLTTQTGDEAEIDGALFFTEAAEGSSGTGLIQAFVRTQATGSEAGYNTSERPLAYDENSSPQFTKSLLLNQAPVVVIDGVAYYEFRLDINQTNNNSLLSLNELKVYKSTTGDYSGEIDDPSFDGPTTLVWDMDDQDVDGTDDDDNTILLDYSLQAGSGKSDMFFYVPVSNFGGANPDTTYVVLYSEFGNTGTLDASDGGDIDPLLYGDYSSNDGFEEWSVSKEIGDNFISGFKWLDTNGDGVWNDTEPGLGGWKIDYTYTVGNGPDEHEVSGSIVTSDGTTDYDGDGNLDDVGFYVIPIEANHKDYTITLTEVSQNGWINTFDGDGTADYVTTVLIDKDLVGLPNGDFGVTEPLNFGNFELFEISGTKFEDENGDGQTTGDSGLAGWTVFIDDDNDGVDEATDGNGQLDAGEKFDVTDANGNWSITGLDASYNGLKVLEQNQAGWVQTLGALGYVIAGSSGDNQEDIDFANFELFDISGTKFEDENGDGDTTGDSGLAGWTVFIDDDNDGVDEATDGNGQLDAGEKFDVTDANGNWSITGLDASYNGLKVLEQNQAGWVQTLGALGYVIAGSSGDNQEDIDFANFELFDISGTKYNDLDGDGVIEAGEPGLAGWTIFIDADNNNQIAGDTNNDGVLDVGETWTEKYAFTDGNGDWAITGLDASYDGLSVKEFIKADWIQTLGPVGAIVGTSGNDQEDIDFGNFLPDPKIDLEKSVKTNLFDYLPEDGDDDPDGLLAATNSTVTFKVVVTNTGNETLSGIKLTDSVIHTVNGVPTSQDIVYTPDGDPATLDAFNVFVDLNNDTFEDPGEAWSNFDTDGDGIIDAGSIAELAPDETFTLYYSLNSLLGQHENTGKVDAVSAISNTAVTDSDDANYYVVEEDCVGVRTPGFWQNSKWATFWDGVSDNQPKQAGTPGFAAGELLYAVDSDGNDIVNPLDTNGDGFINGAPKDGIFDNKPIDSSVGLLIGDYNKNGVQDGDEDTIFISLADAKTLINASSKQLVDGKTADGIYMLGRDVVAAWLNYLANNPEDDTGNCIGTVSGGDTNSPREFLDAAIDWLQQFASDANDGGNPNTTNFHSAVDWTKFEFDSRVAPSSSAWQNPFTVGDDIPVSAAAMHAAIDGYNNTGTINGIEYCCDAENHSALLALNQIALI